jgi:hypothetical protein
MNPVWIALGAVAIALIPVLLARKAAKRKKDNGDGGTPVASDADNRDRTDSDLGGDSGGDGGGGD